MPATTQTGWLSAALQTFEGYTLRERVVKAERARRRDRSLCGWTLSGWSV